MCFWHQLQVLQSEIPRVNVLVADTDGWIQIPSKSDLHVLVWKGFYYLCLLSNSWTFPTTCHAFCKRLGTSFASPLAINYPGQPFLCFAFLRVWTWQIRDLEARENQRSSQEWIFGVPRCHSHAWAKHDYQVAGVTSCNWEFGRVSIRIDK